MDFLYNLILKMGGDNKIISTIGKIEEGMNRTGRTVDNISKKLNAISLDSMLNNINRVASGLDGVSKPGLDLSTSMYDLQAITGVAGDKLKEIEGYARQSAKTFGGDAASAVESYKLILSQLNPEIAKSPSALQAMGNSIATLSKTMGGDSVAATETLTTAMNQYGISTDDPIAASKTMASMMNVMAAGAKEGSAELPQIKQALENAGMAAKGANVSFEETNAAIQVLDKAGKKGAEGGIALRNAIAIMGEGRFMPPATQKALKAAGVDMAALSDTSLPLATRLRLLTPVMNDGALLTKLFGMENQNAARALISGVPEIERLTTAITGTNTAYEQAAIVMESPAEKNKRLQATVDDLKLSLFNGTNGWLGYAGVIGSTTRSFTDMAPLFIGAGKAISTLTSATKLQALWANIVSGATAVWAGVQSVFNTIMAVNPIVWVVAAIIALIAVISYVIYKTDGWGKMWDHTVKAAGFLWEAFSASAKWQWDTFINAINIGLNLIKQGWYEFKNAVGMGDENENNSILAKIHADTEARKNAIVDGGKKVAELYGKSAEEFGKAAGSLSWNSERTLSSMIGGMKAEAGIAAPAVAPGSSAVVGGKGGATGATKKTNEAIATGGTKNTTVHITIGKQIETLKIEAANIKEGAARMRDIIVDELTRAVAMGGALGS